MKEWHYSLPMKFIATLLFLVTGVVSVVGSFGVAFMIDRGYYNENIKFEDSVFYSNLVSNYSNEIFYQYFPLAMREQKAASSPDSEESTLTDYETYTLTDYKKKFDPASTAVFFVITSAADEEVFTNMQGRDIPISPYGRIFYTDDNEQNFRVLIVFDPQPGTNWENTFPDYANAQIWHGRLITYRYTIFWIVAFCLIAAIAWFVYLMSAAGHVRGREGITLSWMDRIPLDLLAAILILAAAFFPAVAQGNYMGDGIIELTILVLTGVAAAIPILALLVSFAVRVKAGKWWLNTLCYRVLNLLMKILRTIIRVGAAIIRNRSLLWKVIVGYALFGLGNLFLISWVMDAYSPGFPLLLIFVFDASVLALLCIFSLHMQQLKAAGRRLANGDFAAKVDVSKMIGAFREHGEALNSISGGMSKAVDERMKTERLKTELITNVSHDIKTPLTSIVNYVDLLKKEEIDNEQAAQYIEVLDRQSARLKKLITDLVEASKASTGNIAYSPEHTNVGELLRQSVGEYNERLIAERLEPVLRIPEDDAAILTDGRLMWRIFDNLLGNICKYSLPGTRVYMDVIVTPERVSVALKNISRNPLNVSADELVERFVRGDSSRATEGSGLGLSIAKSLTELQGGIFELAVDGDLFKAMVSFRRITELDS